MIDIFHLIYIETNLLVCYAHLYLAPVYVYACMRVYIVEPLSWSVFVCCMCLWYCVHLCVFMQLYKCVFKDYV